MIFDDENKDEKNLDCKFFIIVYINDKKKDWYQLKEGLDNKLMKFKC